MKSLRYIPSLLLVLIAFTTKAQQLDSPKISTDSYLFSDSTKIEIISNQPGVKVLMEVPNGSEPKFEECDLSFYVKDSRTIRIKAVHPDFKDSEVTSVKLFKKSELTIELQGKDQHLIDGKRGSLEQLEEGWSAISASEVVFQFSTEQKRLQEVEVLSLINTSKEILPPKKVSLYAHLKNGDKVHIRTVNTIGKFKDSHEYWSHSLRLLGKPKLKKLLRKTVYFSIKVTPHIENDSPKYLFLDEILVR